MKLDNSLVLLYTVKLLISNMNTHTCKHFDGLRLIETESMAEGIGQANIVLLVFMHLSDLLLRDFIEIFMLSQIFSSVIFTYPCSAVNTLNNF